jgi:cytosine/adenosine deaminase-related metal-dependent hydrolase
VKIFCAKYILPVTSEVIEDGAVVIEGRKIVDFGKREEIEFKFKDIATRKIDLKNALIMPGFVNAHTHLELSDFKMERPNDFKEWLWEIVLRKDEKYAPKMV